MQQEELGSPAPRVPQWPVEVQAVERGAPELLVVVVVVSEERRPRQGGEGESPGRGQPPPPPLVGPLPALQVRVSDPVCCLRYRCLRGSEIVIQV